MLKYIVISVLILCTHFSFAQTKSDTVHLYFDLNIATLNSKTKDKVDLLVYDDRIYPGANIMIIGYADYLGSERLNEKLSEARAKNVAVYLEKYGIDKANIKLCIGKGEVKRVATGAEGYPTDRRVDIVLQSKTGGNRNKELVAKNKNIPSPSVSAKPAPGINADVTDLARIKPGEAIVLRNIYFPAQSHDISASLPTLDKLYNILITNPHMKIQIEGHVCCIVGFPDAYDIDAQDNNLSVNRAKAIYDYLINRGISADRLKYAGFGKSRPIVAIEKNEDDAGKNRRVEIRILEK